MCVCVCAGGGGGAELFFNAGMTSGPDHVNCENADGWSKRQTFRPVISRSLYLVRKYLKQYNGLRNICILC